MRGSDWTEIILFISYLATGCAISDADRCLDGFYFEDNHCFKETDTADDTDTTTDTGPGPQTDAGADSGQVGDHGLGEACSCTAEGCDMMGVPLPGGGPITGCNNLPPNWPGANKVCLRSYTGDFGNDSFFANGYCSLMASKCEGANMICDSGNIGDYDSMDSCPPGSVMLTGSVDVVLSTLEAKIDSKYCAPSCETDAECRNDETDPVFVGASTEYQCIELDGVGFCFDPRNLTDDVSAEAF